MHPFLSKLDKKAKKNWEKDHSKKNIEGHLKLNHNEWEEAMCDARGIKFGTGWIQTRGSDIHDSMEKLGPILQNQPEQAEMMQLQVVEYELSQLVIEAAEILGHAGKLQEAIRNLRMSNATVVELKKEKEAGNPFTQKKG